VQTAGRKGSRSLQKVICVKLLTDVLCPLSASSLEQSHAYLAWRQRLTAATGNSVFGRTLATAVFPASCNRTILQLLMPYDALSVIAAV